MTLAVFRAVCILLGALPLFLTQPLAAQDAASAGFLQVLLEMDFDVASQDDILLDPAWRQVQLGSQGFACISNDHARYGDFPKFLIGDSRWQNYSIEAVVRFRTWQDTGQVALLTRLDGGWLGYRHALLFGEWGARLFHYYYGGEDPAKSADLGAEELPPPAFDWAVLRAEVEGDTARTFLNGMVLADDHLRYSQRGYAGIEVGPGVYLCMDRLVVRSLNHTAAAIAAAPRALVTRDTNMRLWPGVRQVVIAPARKGEEVFVLERDGNWVYVRQQDTAVQGWVWGRFVQTA